MNSTPRVLTTITSIDQPRRPTLVVLTGPTGIGKTELSIRLAKTLNTEIVSSDSRQIYREIKIGTAAPSPGQLATVPHHMIGSHSIHEYYNAYEYEQDVLNLLTSIFEVKETALLVGGSMMYIDALCNGIDDLPTISQEVRSLVMELYHTQGLEFLQEELMRLDPVFYAEIDLKNPKRVIHAVEVCLMTGRPYSALRTKTVRERPFNILRIALDMDREQLYQRINQRVEAMMAEGLEAEARAFYPLRHLNALNTVGYKELFSHFDGELTLPEAVDLIKRNTRRYAKRQLTWFRRDNSYFWFNPEQQEEIIKFVQAKISAPGQ